MREAGTGSACGGLWSAQLAHFAIMHYFLVWDGTRPIFGTHFLIWTSIHLQYDLFLLIPIFLIGLLLGYLMHKYNSLYLVIIVHAVHNLQATLFIEFFYDYFY